MHASEVQILKDLTVLAYSAIKRIGRLIVTGQSRAEPNGSYSLIRTHSQIPVNDRDGSIQRTTWVTTRHACHTKNREYLVAVYTHKFHEDYQYPIRHTARHTFFPLLKINSSLQKGLSTSTTCHSMIFACSSRNYARVMLLLQFHNDAARIMYQ